MKIALSLCALFIGLQLSTSASYADQPGDYSYDTPVEQPELLPEPVEQPTCGGCQPVPTCNRCRRVVVPNAYDYTYDYDLGEYGSYGPIYGNGYAYPYAAGDCRIIATVNGIFQVIYNGQLAAQGTWQQIQLTLFNLQNNGISCRRIN